ncbi:MAG: ATP-dependent helicase [Clostridiales bacterium]|nr:ATP-dependent helicase [Clostridiales bacterium]
MTVKLDAAQKKAMKHINGPFLCIAGPGSGKTTVMIHRVANMVSKGVNPNQILVLTFSKAATTELEQRYSKLQGGIIGVWFCTIHEFAWKVAMDPVRGGYSGYKVLDGASQTLCFRILLKETQLFDDYMQLETLLKKIGRDISTYRLLDRAKRATFQGEAFNSPDAFQIFYNAYKKYKQEGKWLDFDDMLHCTRRIFQEHPDVLDYYRNIYQYILVDEFQDTSALQAWIIYALARPRDNIFICGDDDQSIYAWRNAKPEIMLRFEKDFPGCDVARLITNYRSDKTIIEAASNLIAFNKTRFEKDITGISENTGTVHVLYESRDGGEDPLIAKIMEENQNGTAFYDMAVLTRTNREAKLISSKCFSNNIPFYCKVAIDNPYRGFLFDTMMHYLQIAYGDDSWKTISHIINRPFRYFSKEMLAECRSLSDMLTWAEDHYARGHKKRIKDFMANLKIIQVYAETAPGPFVVAGLIWKLFNIEKYVQDTCRYIVEDPEMVMDRFDEMMSDLHDAKSLDEFQSIVQIKEKIYEQAAAEGAKNKDRGITISTMHGAKGLEWDLVFVGSCFDGNIPFHKKDEHLTDEKMEEERRLFYVAMTRAKEKCYVITDNYHTPSGFLAEAKLMDNIPKKTKKAVVSDMPKEDRVYDRAAV